MAKISYKRKHLIDVLAVTGAVPGNLHLIDNHEAAREGREGKEVSSSTNWGWCDF